MKKLKVKLRLWSALFLTAWAGFSLSAQSEGLQLHYDFEQSSGTSVPDASPSGVTATLMNQAQVVEMGKYHVLDLGNGTGYLDLTSRAGDIFRALDTYTISVYYRVDEEASLAGNGYFLWAFSTSPTCTATEGKFSAYRLNAQRFANSTGGYNNESGIQIGRESDKGRWIHVLYTQNGASGTLYIDGQRRGTLSTMPLNSANFTTNIPYVWIGRAPFSGDNYLTQTLVYDFRLYDHVLNATEIADLATLTDSLDYEYRYGSVGDFSALRTAIEEARQFVADEGANCPAAAVRIFEDEINVAQDLLDEGLVNQSLIDEQVANLAAAQATLKATRGFSLDLSGISTGYDTDRGFRHPGALHTDDDFARIRRQLNDSTGNERVKEAYEILKNAEYAQASCATHPVEIIVRGGGTGENYINAARGATIAYQNALRWKIDGSEAHARHAVEVLMAWARTTKALGGDTNISLAAGLYGYQFANAAELMRDYEGWSREDFNEFKRWMLDVWYPACIDFLRRRHDTWANVGKWGECPGHYWSNWGLCNALAVVSIGILCDDVFIYNQGMSFFKYDQVGTFVDPRTADPILNDGLTEFLGNLVVTTTESDLETGAYGKLGQMQESGRDVGHAMMAAGLAIDLAHTGWNQGDDLFSYMDHRLAAGIEYIAAQSQSIQGLPWTDYHRASSGYAWWDGRSELMTAPQLGKQIRPYWGTVIGHYEGVKGVKMPFSEMAYNDMGIDGGGLGAVSGGYDHLGYSVLMNTRDTLAAPDSVPTPLTPVMEYNDTVVEHNELGGLRNTYAVTPTTALPAGTVVTLKPQLPDSVSDTGLWRWDSGETTRNLTVTANESHVYRVTYTNEHGVKSQQVFTLAVAGDCETTRTTPHIAYNGTTYNTTSLTVLYGSAVTLSLDGDGRWSQWLWENGSTETSINLPHVTGNHEISVVYTNQGGRKHLTTFRIYVENIRPDITVGSTTYRDSTVAVVNSGSDVTLSATSTGTRPTTYLWSDGSTEPTLVLNDVRTSGTYTVECTSGDITEQVTFYIYVPVARYVTLESGNYLIHHTRYDTYLTNLGDGTPARFSPLDEANPLSQQWRVQYNPPLTTIYSFISLQDSTYLTAEGEFSSLLALPFRLSGAAGTEQVAIQKSATSGLRFWRVSPDGTIDFAATASANDYPFEFIAIGSGEDTGLEAPNAGERTPVRTYYYSIDGIRLPGPQKGLNLRQTTYSDGTTAVEKILID